MMESSLVLRAIREQSPDKVALVDESGTMSYGALADAIEEKAAVLSGKVAVLGIALDNGIDWLLWDLAAMRAEVPCIPLPAFFNDQQINHIILSAGITHIVSATGLLSTGGMPLGIIPAGTAKITFTSGTTGTPKGVCLPQAGMERVAQSLVDVLGPGMAGRHMSVLPLAILLENVAGLYASLLAGGTCYLFGLSTMGMASPFQPDFLRLGQMLQTHDINSVILVPELLRGLMQAVAAGEFKLSALRFAAVGGSRVAPELISQARSLGFPVYEGYGLSECASVVALNVPGIDEPGTVGKILPHVDLSFEDGEIIIHHPAFLGYLGQPHKGSLATGDIGRLTAEGFLQISGRRKNVIITSFGRNISPEWLESALLAQPEILQALVYGDAAPAPGALIVPASKTADVEKAVARANATLPDYAHLAAYHVVAPFTLQDGTLTGNGRPRRTAILQKYQSLITKEKDHELLQHAG